MKTYGWRPQREKKRRAFQAYLALLDTSDWLRHEMERHLKGLDFSLMQLRVMRVLLHAGPRHQEALSRRIRRSKQTIGFVVRRLEMNGWVERVPSRLRSRGEDSDGGARRGEKRGRNFTGRQVILIRATAEGKEKIADVFTKHAKVVQAYMAALDGREQLTLARLCEKLRKEDVLKFCREIRRANFEDEKLRSADVALRSGS